MNYSILVFLFIISLIFTFFVSGYTKKMAIKYTIGSFPNNRMVHTGFIPRIGGIGIFSGFLLMIALSLIFFDLADAEFKHYWYIICGALVIFILGLLDDLKGLNAPQKFTGQFIAATLVILSGCQIDLITNPFDENLSLGFLSIPFTYLWIIGVTNAVNLLDGLDGLAAGVSLIVVICFGIVGFVMGKIIIIVFCIALVAGLLGFLKHNYHPASLFMGDTGSLFLGFILATLALKVFEDSSEPLALIFPVLVLAIPIGDTTVSFFRRLNSGHHPFKADKDHLHHRLIYLGLSHRQTVYIIYLFTIAYGFSALLLAFDLKIIGFAILTLTIMISAMGLRRLGYLEARKFKTMYGDDTLIRVEKELAPLSLKRFIHRIIIAVTDIITLNIAMVLFVWIRYEMGFLYRSNIPFNEILSFQPLLFVTMGWIFLFVLNNLYSMRWDIARFDKIRRITKTILFGILIWFLVTWDASHILSQSRLSIILYALLLIVLVSSGRLLIILIEKKFKIFEYAPQNTLLVGSTEKARKLLKDIRKNPHLLYNVVGFVNKNKDKEYFSDLKFLGTYSDIPEIVRTYGIQEIIIAINERSRDEILNIVALVDQMKVVFKIIPQFYDVVSGHKTQEMIGHPLIRLFPDHMNLWQWLLKRFFDISFALLLIILLTPLAIFINLLILISGTSPIFSIINIVGKNGKQFGMLNYNINSRKTLVQKVLYKTNLYKFPELINIILGKMSFVGPRPEKPEDVKRIKEKIRFYNRRFQVRPGLTGHAQVKYRYDDSLKSKRDQYKQDLFYLENMSLTFDFRILLRSLYILLFKKI